MLHSKILMAQEPQSSHILGSSTGVEPSRLGTALTEVTRTTALQRLNPHASWCLSFQAVSASYTTHRPHNHWAYFYAIRPFMVLTINNQLSYLYISMCCTPHSTCVLAHPISRFQTPLILDYLVHSLDSLPAIRLPILRRVDYSWCLSFQAVNCRV